jgi:endonuclease I
LIRQLRNAAIVLALAAFLAHSSRGDVYDPPASYYSGATGTGATLKGQLLTIMSTDHIQRTYGNFRDSAAISDAHPTLPGQIWLVYDRAIVPATWTNGSTWDREHIWPQSLQGGGSVNNGDTGHRADPHALRPSTPTVNSNRGNKPFGLLTDSGGHGPADDNSAYYYPGDTDAGDVARSLFYSATRWSSLGLTLVNGNPSSYQMGDLASLIKYHFQDPPDTFERRRNHTIYSQADNPLYYTNNRNAYVDRPEYVWSVYVDQANDSRITINGTTPDANGGSTRNVDLGRVFTGSAVPSAQTFTLNKSGTDGTYFEVTTSDPIVSSSITGRNNAFRTNQIDSKSITVGLNTNTATAGLRSGIVTIDNLDVTTAGGAGRGANDAIDTFNVSLTVLDHATASFESAATTLTRTLDFGTLTTASDPLTLFFNVFNRDTTTGFTANMDFDSIIGSGDTSVITTNAGAQAGSLVLAGGAGQMLSAAINTSTVGSFSASYTLNFCDENLAGAQNDVLTLNLSGQVLLAGDFNRDSMVDAADYLVWQKTYGQSVAAAYDWGDGDGDLFVDDDDLLVWQTHFGETAGGGGLAVDAGVPEPNCIFLMVIGIGMFAGFQRHG